MRTRMVAAAAAIGLVVACSSAAASEEELEPVHVSIAEITVEYGCGPTPSPNRPPPQCPSHVQIKLTYVGDGCTDADFVMRIRERPEVQVWKVFKKASATHCFVAPSGSPGTFSSVTLLGGGIDPRKRVRLANPLALVGVPRP